MAYSIFLMASLLFAFLMLFIIISAFWGFLLTRVPFVPTYKSDIEFIVKKLKFTSKDTFYDLGSGDGRVCFLANQLTGARCVGYELTWWTYLLAKLKGKMQKLALHRNGVTGAGSQVQFKNQNFFKADWSQATVVYAYLYPLLMKRVEEKFQAEMKPGSLAVIRDFPFPSLKPVEIYSMPKKHEIFVYKL